MKKKILAAGVAAAAGVGVAAVIKKKREDGDVILKRIYPENAANQGINATINSLKDKLEDFQINVLYAADVPLDYLKKTTENLKGEFIRTEENFRRAMERSQSKLSSELLKAQMTIHEKRKDSKDAAKAKIYADQKEKDAALAKALREDAKALNSFALNLMEEAMTASVEAEAFAKEYEANYGEALFSPTDKILADLTEKEEEA